MAVKTVFLYVALLAAIATIVYAVTLFNSLVRLRNENDRAWSNIDVLLKQRHDELPNLIEACKGYMKYEQETLQKIVEARAASGSAISIADKALADGMTTAAITKLFAVAESYPELHASQTFMQLQGRISELEEKIADRREFYNADVAMYNSRIASFPEMFFANLMAMKTRDYFKVSEEEQQIVNVKFA
jgi:LemA protein